MQELPLPGIRPTTGPGARIGAPVRPASTAFVGSQGLSGLNALAAAIQDQKNQRDIEAAESAFAANPELFTAYAADQSSPEAAEVRRRVEAGEIPRSATGAYWNRINSLAAGQMVEDYSTRLNEIVNDRDYWVDPETGLPRQDLDPEAVADQLWNEEFGGQALAAHPAAAAAINQLRPQVRSSFVQRAGTAVEARAQEAEDRLFTDQLSSAFYQALEEDPSLTGTELDEISGTIQAFFENGLPHTRKLTLASVQDAVDRKLREGGAGSAEQAALFLDAIFERGETDMAFKFGAEEAQAFYDLEDRVDREIESRRNQDAREGERTRVRMSALLQREYLVSTEDRVGLSALERDPDADLDAFRIDARREIEQREDLTGDERAALLESFEARMDRAYSRQSNARSLGRAEETLEEQQFVDSLSRRLREGMTPEEARAELADLDDLVNLTDSGFQNLDQLIRRYEANSDILRDPAVAANLSAAQKGIDRLPPQDRAAAQAAFDVKRDQLVMDGELKGAAAISFSQQLRDEVTQDSDTKVQAHEQARRTALSEYTRQSNSGELRAGDTAEAVERGELGAEEAANLERQSISVSQQLTQSFSVYRNPSLADSRRLLEAAVPFDFDGLSYADQSSIRSAMMEVGREVEDEIRKQLREGSLDPVDQPRRASELLEEAVNRKGLELLQERRESTTDETEQAALDATIDLMMARPGVSSADQAQVENFRRAQEQVARFGGDASLTRRFKEGRLPSTVTKDDVERLSQFQVDGTGWAQDEVRMVPFNATRRALMSGQGREVMVATALHTQGAIGLDMGELMEEGVLRITVPESRQQAAQRRLDYWNGSKGQARLQALLERRGALEQRAAQIDAATEDQEARSLDPLQQLIGLTQDSRKRGRENAIAKLDADINKIMDEIELSTDVVRGLELQVTPEDLRNHLDHFNSVLLFPGEGTPVQNLQAQDTAARNEGTRLEWAQSFGLEGDRERIDAWAALQINRLSNR